MELIASRNLGQCREFFLVLLLFRFCTFFSSFYLLIEIRLTDGGISCRANSDPESKDFIYRDAKVRLFEALPVCNPKIRPPYWKFDNERW